MNSEFADSPLTGPIRKGVNAYLRGMMTCIPGQVVTFNPKKQSAQVECGIQRQINGEWRTIPVINDVRVQFPGDNEWYFWHQITQGTTGLIHFSQRAIDTWLEQGGPVAPHELRMFSAEDAFFVPGIRPNPGLIPGFVNEGMGMSNYGGDTRVHLTDGQIKWTAGGSAMTLNGSGLDVQTPATTITSETTTINAATTVNGNLGTNGTMRNNGENVGSTHTHPQANDSGGDSEQDTGYPK